MANSAKRAVAHLLERAGYRVEGIRYTPRQLLEPGRLRALDFDDVVCRHMFEVGERLTFVQVGAYDGVAADPLRRYVERCGWRGVMLEPNPKPAEAVRLLYADRPEVVIMQAALDAMRGSRTLYTVDSEGLRPWTDRIASFDREHIVRHAAFVPDLVNRVREVEVPCVTFADVLERLPAAPDLLQIDTEGADGFILSLFPFADVKPAIVHFESKHLSLGDKEVALDLLASHGYLVAPSGGENMLAVLPLS